MRVGILAAVVLLAALAVQPSSAQPPQGATPAAPEEDEPGPQPPVAADVRGGHGELGRVTVLALSLGALLGFAGVRLGRLRSEP